jgi:hypothetical protein
MILDQIADYVTALMAFDPSKVIIGRENAIKENFSQNYIVIDTLAPAVNFSNGRDYNPITEKEKLNTVQKGSFTLEFYGTDSDSNCNKFVNLQSSQQGKDLQKTYGITCYKASNINNLKQLVGNKYFDRYEIEVMVLYNDSFEIDTLRIEEIPTVYVTE